MILVLGLVGLAVWGLSTQLSIPRAQDPAPASGQVQGVHVFFSAGCADCWPYVEQDLMPALAAGGLSARAEIHDYTVPAERTQLLQMADDIELPRSIADSLYAFIPVQS